MGMQYDVLASIPLTATGQAKNQAGQNLGRVRIKTIYGISGATAGSVVIRDGGTGGDVLITVNTPAKADSGTFWLPLPGEGILAKTDVHVTVTSIGSVTLIYG
jgi:hypothetical protein